MNIAIVYSSNTGNTKKVAEAIKKQLENENIVYFGKPNEEISLADIYFIGSWTNKGNASNDIIEFVKKIKNKKIAYFGTAGYGGSKDYYKTLFERIEKEIDFSNQVLGYFYCQGKMPIQVRERYVKMMTENPEDANLKVNIENFDKALLHPDELDLENVKEWAENMVNIGSRCKIITLCGSIKFKDEFMKVQERLTLKGNIVFTPNFFNNIKKEEISLETKKMLDKMHRQKIDMSDEIYVINVGGYIGESTKSEIEYARKKGKMLSYLENIQ